METNIRDLILQKKKEIKELKLHFLKENVGNTFYFSETHYMSNHWNGEYYNEIPIRYIYVYEENGEILTKHIIVKHISKSDPSKWICECANWECSVYETLYEKVVSDVKNFDYFDSIIENNSIADELPEDIEYLVKNVKEYNITGGRSFIIRDETPMKEKLNIIKQFTNGKY